MLENINKSTWALIATTFQNIVATDAKGVVAPIATTVAITEGLLRDILCLIPDQQHELISDLIAGSTPPERLKIDNPHKSKVAITLIIRH